MDRDCNNCIWHTSGQCANWNCEPVSRKEALEALEKVKAMESAQPEQRWIPCEEALPEEYGEFRITWTTSASKKRFLGDAEYELSGEWDDDLCRNKGEWLLEDYVKEFPDVKVIAWKPLEEPYGGE